MIRKVDTGFPRRSCSNKRIELDDDSKKSHHALEGSSRETEFLLPLPQGFLPVFCQRREQVADDSARTCLELDRHGHSGAELDALLVDLHLRAVKRDARGILKLLTFRLAGTRRRARGPVIRRVLLRVAGDG